MTDDELDIPPQAVVPILGEGEYPAWEQRLARLSLEQREALREFADFLLQYASGRVPRARGARTGQRGEFASPQPDEP
ncbi:MAG: hypothetical protein RMM58_06920 [Chloroflexota bacterium]|nr:hypothetical protein [Dehalococcoidia bacterium]MDW8253594.1 hypothetical protein [Chloroflexota bacterium]